MAGQLTIDTLKASSGVLATQNGMTGISKAWCIYNGSTQTVINSFNISSVTRVGAGNYTFNYTTALTTVGAVSMSGPSVSGVGYCIACQSNSSPPSTTSCGVFLVQQNSGTSNTTTDNTSSCIVVYGT